MARTFVARLWLPDIPGTLGLVAAAIGKAGGDVIGIEILERGEGLAIDELLIQIPDASEVDDLIAGVASVAGVNVEDVHQVDPQRQDQSILALEIAARIMESPHGERLSMACTLIRDMLESDWSCVLGTSTHDLAIGTVPDPAWLRAFLEGIGHLDSGDSHEHTPGDVAWAGLPRIGGFFVCGRHSRSFRSRERQHLALIARIVDSVVGGGPMAGALDGA